MVKHFKAGKVVIINVTRGRHRVLVDAIKGDSFIVRDPALFAKSYAFSSVSDSGIFTKNR